MGEAAGLTRESILEAAFGVLEETGIDGFSTRRLAARLAVQPGALYWHFPSKQSILDAMADQIAAAVSPPRAAAGIHQLQATAQGLRAAMLAHRDGARLVTTMSTPGPVAMALFTAIQEVIAASGTTPAEALVAADVLTSFVNGYTIEEQARKLGQSPQARNRAFRQAVRLVLAGFPGQP